MLTKIGYFSISVPFLIAFYMTSIKILSILIGLLLLKSGSLLLANHNSEKPRIIVLTDIMI